MLDLIIGQGQIGQAVAEVLEVYNYRDVIVRDVVDMETNKKIEVMHVCFPYDKNFINQVKGYIKQYNPKHVLVWSTVEIGTCKAIDKRICHTPVEGKHPSLATSILKSPRWFGYNIEEEGLYFSKYFTRLDLFAKAVESTDYTEALKLLSTSEYGINLVFADYKAKLAKKLKMDYGLMKEWNVDYNELYQDLGMPQFQKYVLDPPNSKIGGHCVVPNAKILNKTLPDDMLKRIKEME